MKKQYQISGMTCNGCVAKVRQGLEQLEGVEVLNVQLEIPQATLEIKNDTSLEQLQEVIGHYQITEQPRSQPAILEEEIPAPSVGTYKPLIIIVSFLIGTTLLVQYPFDTFSWQVWMRHFMAGFFLVFSFFKLLNIEGFAQSYRMYDILAIRWKMWGYIYPFIELALGILYLINVAPFFTNFSTLVILGFSSIGVIQSNLNKQKIKCACLGDVFNLPMSTVTIIEDLTMVVMAGMMLWMQ